MKEIIAYHVVTDRPMRTRQHIVFDRTQNNGVYRRVMEKVPMVEEAIVGAVVEEAGKWAELFIGWNRPVMPLSGLK